VGVNYTVIDYSARHDEVFWLDGVRVARALPSCSHCGTEPGEPFVLDIPVSEAELAAENQRVEREVGEVQQLRAQGKTASTPDDPPQILLSRFLALGSFSNPRREVVDGRPTILLDFVWNSSMTPANANETLLQAFAGTVRIDEEDHAVQQVEGSFLADVKLEEGKIRIRKGTRIKISTRRVEPGIWLLSRMDARGEGHYFGFAINGDGHMFVGKYRKFRATSTIHFDPEHATPK
jgi:hypothetical protein